MGRESFAWHHRSILRGSASLMSRCLDKPSTKVYLLLERGDHPEIDESNLLDKLGIEQYQSLIGFLQWAISLECFDIASAVMSMLSFHIAPRRGHLQQLQRICEYLVKMKHA